MERQSGSSSPSHVAALLLKYLTYIQITAALNSQGQFNFHQVRIDSICSVSCCMRVTHLVLELLTELQGDGEEYQRVIQPGHHTLYLMNVAHFKPVVVELTVEERLIKGTWKTNILRWYSAKLHFQTDLQNAEKNQTGHTNSFLCKRYQKQSSRSYNIAPGLCNTELPAGLKF